MKLDQFYVFWFYNNFCIFKCFGMSQIFHCKNVFEPVSFIISAYKVVLFKNQWRRLGFAYMCDVKIDWIETCLIVIIINNRPFESITWLCVLQRLCCYWPWPWMKIRAFFSFSLTVYSIQLRLVYLKKCWIRRRLTTSKRKLTNSFQFADFSMHIMGASINYVDRILRIFWSPAPLHWQVYCISFGRPSSSPLIVSVVYGCPQMYCTGSISHGIHQCIK